MAEHAEQLDAQAQRLAAIKQKQQDRENGIRAQAAKKAREEERALWEPKLSALEANHAGQLQGMAKAHAQEMERAVRTHRGAARAMGAIYGACLAAVLVSLGFLTVVDRAMQQAFDRAQEIAAASTLVGAATQRRDEQ